MAVRVRRLPYDGCDGRRVFVWRPSKGRTTAAAQPPIRHKESSVIQYPEKGRRPSPSRISIESGTPARRQHFKQPLPALHRATTDISNNNYRHNTHDADTPRCKRTAAMPAQAWGSHDMPENPSCSNNRVVLSSGAAALSFGNGPLCLWGRFARTIRSQDEIKLAPLQIGLGHLYFYGVAQLIFVVMTAAA